MTHGTESKKICIKILNHNDYNELRLRNLDTCIFLKKSCVDMCGLYWCWATADTESTARWHFSKVERW